MRRATRGDISRNRANFVDLLTTQHKNVKRSLSRRNNNAHRVGRRDRREALTGRRLCASQRAAANRRDAIDDSCRSNAVGNRLGTIAATHVAVARRVGQTP